MNRRVLCVDDEPDLLQGLQRTLRKEFDITIAEGGAQALALIESNDPFAVIVSDMRMPEMDGVQLLAKVKDMSPDSVRMMLTGNADQQTAMDAINEGNIFRFLTKPCDSDKLIHSLRAGVEQYRLITTEKELLEETLHKSMQVMVELLAMANTTAFGRTIRVKHLAHKISLQLGIRNLWQMELAALLSQVGTITVPQEILLKVFNNQPLLPEEQELYDTHPQITYNLLIRIPRLQVVAEIIAHQNYHFDDPPESLEQTSDPALVKCCAQILRVASDFDRLIYAGQSPQQAWYELTQRSGWYLPMLLEMLKQLIGPGTDETLEAHLPIAEVKPGMLLDQTLTSKTGEPLLAAGQEITESLLVRFDNFVQAGLIEAEIDVRTSFHPL